MTLDPNQDDSPDVSGNLIVYTSSRLGDQDIFLFDLSTGLEQVLAGGPGAQVDPRIDGNTVVWADVSLVSRIRATVIGLGAIIDVAPGVEGSAPDVSQNRDVFVRNSADVAVTDLTTGITQVLTSSPVVPSPPVIHGDLVGWNDARNGNQDVFLYDLSDGAEYQLTSGPSVQALSDVQDTFVLASDNTFGLPDVIRIDFDINHAPIVTTSGDQERLLGETVTLTATATDPDGDAVTAVQWVFASRPATSTALLSGADTLTASFVPDTAGDYVLTFTATDGIDTSTPATAVISVTENLPPVVVLVATPTSGTAPLSVLFDASGTTDPEGQPLSFAWDFGDGSPSETGPVLTHTFVTPGIYAVGLLVSDGEASVSAQVTVEVTPVVVDFEVSVTRAELKRNRKKGTGRVRVEGTFTPRDMPAPSDLIAMEIDGVSLISAPFDVFTLQDEDEEPGAQVWRFQEKDVMVKIDFLNGTFRAFRRKLMVGGIDNTNGVDFVLTVGADQALDAFSFAEKGEHLRLHIPAHPEHPFWLNVNTDSGGR